MSITIINEQKRKEMGQSRPAAFSRSLPRERRQSSSVENARLLIFLPPLLLGLGLLVIWYVVTASGAVPAYELPGPADVRSALWDGITSGLFLSNVWVTVQESLGGFLLAALVALPVGYGIAKGRLFAVTVNPYLAAGQAVPAIVIAPFLVIWLGYGMFALVILCALVVFFPVVMIIALGFKLIDRSLIEAARVEGAVFWPMLGYIEFPLAMPALMTAVRTGLTLSIVGALVGEFVNNSDQGLGALVQIAKSQYNMPLMFAAVVILALLAAAFYGLARGLTWFLEKVFG